MYDICSYICYIKVVVICCKIIRDDAEIKNTKKIKQTLQMKQKKKKKKIWILPEYLCSCVKNKMLIANVVVVLYLNDF